MGEVRSWVSLARASDLTQGLRVLDFISWGRWEALRARRKGLTGLAV